MAGVLVTREVMVFALDWLSGSDGGESSNAMVKAAIKDHVPAAGEYPRDLSDFSRCCLAFTRAPWELKKRMLPILVSWGQALEGVEGIAAATHSREGTQ